MIRLVEADKRSHNHNIWNLVAKELGFKEEEEFGATEKSKVKEGKVFDEKRKIITRFSS